jgi:hypothetical protein
MLRLGVAYNRASGEVATVKECKECKLGEDEAYLEKCPICHEFVCEEHKFVRSGRNFCSVYCADAFFHSDEEDEVDD